MRVNKWKMTLILTICSLLLLLTACGGGESGGNSAAPKAAEGVTELSGVVKFAINGQPVDDGIDPVTGRDVKGMKTVLKPFLEKHPKLTIEYIEIPNDNRYAKWQALFLSGSVDVLNNLGSVIEYYNQGFVLSLDDYLKRDNWKQNYYDSLWQDRERFTNAADGKVMTLPGSVNTNTVVYDKQIFEDWGVAPLSDKPTAQEILEKAAKMTGINPKTGKQTYGMYYDPRGSSHMMLDYFSDGNGVNIGETDWANFGNSKLNFNTPQIKKSLQTMIDMNSSLPPGYEIGRGFENWGKADNNVAICLWCSNMDEVLKNKLQDRYVVTKGVRDKNGKTSFGTAGAYAIAKESKNPEAAWQLLKYLAGPEGQKAFYVNQKALPSWKKADWVDEKENPYAKQLLAVVEDTKNVIFPPIMFSLVRPWMAELISRANHGQKYDLEAEVADIQGKLTKWVEEQKVINAQKDKK
jgi:multiple sugar transport system substrate-binding protein